MTVLINKDSPASDAIAHVPTPSLGYIVEPGFFEKLGDAGYMRIAVWLARKSYDQGGCPIGHRRRHHR